MLTRTPPTLRSARSSEQLQVTVMRAELAALIERHTEVMVPTRRRFRD